MAKSKLEQVRESLWNKLTITAEGTAENPVQVRSKNSVTNLTMEEEEQLVDDLKAAMNQAALNRNELSWARMAKASKR